MTEREWYRARPAAERVICYEQAVCAAGACPAGGCAALPGGCLRGQGRCVSHEVAAAERAIHNPFSRPSGDGVPVAFFAEAAR